MYCDIVILPPPKLRHRIGQQVRIVTRGKPATFIVDNIKLIPHLSLFHIRTSKTQLAKISNMVEQIIKIYTAQKIQTTNVRVGSSGTVVLFLSKPKQLKKLHRELVSKCKIFRTGQMPWTNKQQPNKTEALYRRRYGTQHVLKFFNPHLTLAKLNIKNPKVIAQKLNKIRFSFMGNIVAICQVNYWHQVTKIIYAFRLKQ